MLYVLVNSFVIKEVEWFNSKDCFGEKLNKSKILLSLHSPLKHFKNQFNYKIYKKPMDSTAFVDKDYVVGEHYLGSRYLIKKNKYAEKNSTLGDVKFLEKQNSMKLYIRWDLLLHLKDTLTNYYGFGAETNGGFLNKLLFEKKLKF
jgi:outer membrane cobalamin receptor